MRMLFIFLFKFLCVTSFCLGIYSAIKEDMWTMGFVGLGIGMVFFEMTLFVNEICEYMKFQSLRLSSPYKKTQRKNKHDSLVYAIFGITYIIYLLIFPIGFYLAYAERSWTMIGIAFLLFWLYALICHFNNRWSKCWDMFWNNCHKRRRQAL